MDGEGWGVALFDFLQGRAEEEGVEPGGIFVDSAVLNGESRRLSIRDHNNLAHVFLLAEEDSLSQPQAFARIGLIRAALDAGEFTEGNFFGAVVEKDPPDPIPDTFRSTPHTQGTPPPLSCHE